MAEMGLLELAFAAGERAVKLDRAGDMEEVSSGSVKCHSLHAART